MAEALLRVRQCSFRYAGAAFELRDVSVDVRGGEVLGIVGPNGSGKSTFLRVMSGLLRAAAGSVALDGRPIGSFGRRQLAQRLAFLPQSPESSFPFTARQVVAMGRYPYQSGFGFVTADDARAVGDAMSKTDTGYLAGRNFMTLSGGEKQRVLLASVLAQEPGAMLLDEPTASLDIHHEADVFDVLWRLSRAGMAVVVVTHNLNLASQFCDRLLLLSGGEVVCCGRPATVLDQELLCRVYEAPLRVLTNPITRTPMVVVPGRTAHDEA